VEVEFVRQPCAYVCRGTIPARVLSREWASGGLVSVLKTDVKRSVFSKWFISDRWSRGEGSEALPVIRIYPGAVEIGRGPNPEKFVPVEKKKLGWTRGRISSFSSAARRRMIHLLSKVDKTKLGNPLFLSFTYHKNYQDRDVKRDLNTFLKRLRRFAPGCQWIWRLEPQKRGAPHFHIIVWSALEGEDLSTDGNIEAQCSMWHELVDPSNPWHERYGAKAVQFYDERGVSIYLSKYVAKSEREEDGLGEDVGQRWGHSQDLPTEPLEEIEVTEEIEVLIRRLCRSHLNSQRDKKGRPRRSARKYAKTVVIGHTSHVLMENTEFILRFLAELGALDEWRGVREENGQERGTDRDPPGRIYAGKDRSREIARLLRLALAAEKKNTGGNRVSVFPPVERIAHSTISNNPSEHSTNCARAAE
jgi:hypothetical protein